MKPDGGPAFPIHARDNERFVRGMTLRDYFAGQVLVTMSLSEPRAPADDAAYCYEMADAMIAERDK